MRAKQRLFVECYLRVYNATQAAKDAGYSERTAYSQGQRLLKSVEIKAAIAARWAEQRLGTDEIIGRLAEQARNEGTQFITDTGDVDIKALRAAGKMHLLKASRRTWRGEKITELHDAQAALQMLGKATGALTERIAVDVLTGTRGLSEEELDRLIAARLGDGRSPSGEAGPATG